jgi:hypothetical protein
MHYGNELHMRYCLNYHKVHNAQLQRTAAIGVRQKWLHQMAIKLSAEQNLQLSSDILKLL